jgi:Protein of unknown function (DUF4236)
MGFRFRKSVKLMPGVRYNFSTRGGSLSLGRAGAMINLSSRGVRTTVGLPGTGLSYTTSSGSRRRSAQQIAAAHRRLVEAQQRDAATDAVAKIEAEIAETLNAWRDFPELLSLTDLESELIVRPAANDNADLPAPDFRTAEGALRKKITAEVCANEPRAGKSRFAWLIVGLAAGIGFAFYRIDLGVIAGVCLAVAAEYGSRVDWLNSLKPKIEERMARAWPEERARIEAEHSQREAEHCARKAEAAEKWLAEENARIAELRLLIAGDLGAVERAVSASVEALDFPFEADCAVGVDEAGFVVIDIDLPEIEDVVPETRYKVLKDGTLKEVKRKAEERNEAYATLVTGIAHTVAATALATAPSLQSVTVAGHTQRKNRNNFEAKDTYVFEVRFPRDVIARISAATLEPVSSIQRLPSRIEVGASGVLKQISDPDWAAELWAS